MSKKRQRYVLEGQWSQTRRIYHRAVIYNPEKYKELSTIEFDDGTYLKLKIREAKPYERVEVIHGYDSLINKCLLHKIHRVVDIKNSLLTEKLGKDGGK